MLAGRPLRTDCSLEDTSRYADRIWFLNPAWLRADHRRFTLDFTTLHPPMAEIAKRLFYALLMQDTPPGELPISVSSIRTYYSCVRRFLLWTDARGCTLAQLTGEDLDDYHREVVALRLSAGAIKRHRRAVRMLWAYRSRLPDHLEQDPLRRTAWQAWVRAHSRRPGENLTDRIPEPVLGPLLTWALRWVDDFADDVLAARAERDAIDTRPPAGPDPLAALHALLDDYRRSGQPLPAAPPNLALARQHPKASPNSSYLARLVGFPERRLTKGLASRRMIAEAARELGVDTDCPLTHVVQGRLEGSPWLQRVSYYEAARLERLLQVSCWTVIAYLSGMRDSEIKHLQRGCVSVQRDPDGQIYRYRLNSLAFKGEDAHGAKATWVVTAPVARAVAVLERLQPNDQPYLFAKPPSSPSHRQRQDPHHVPNSNTTNRDLAALITWINTYCAAHQRPDSIPHVKGQIPHLTTRQFRRTLAWFIARRPGGTIAGALQYRHQGIQMFEGYAGTSDSGFRDEVEAEQALARGQYLADMSTDNDRPALTGPAGAEAEERLAEFARHTVFDGQVVTDEARLRRILARHDPHLYLGAFVTCVYNRDRALCRTPSGPADMPALADCQPLACRNTALTPSNRSALTEHLATLDTTLAEGDRLAPYVRHRLEAQRRDTAAFLARHAPESTP